MINERQASAYDEIMAELKDGEEIEAVVFADINDNYCMEDYHLPREYIGRPLTLREATPYLYGWEISGGYGGEEVIPLYIWTNKRVLLIGCYDGSTWLDGVPRNPIKCEPYTIGGG